MQACEPKTESRRFFQPVVLGFSQPKTDFFLIGFSVAPKKKKPKHRRSFIFTVPITPTDLYGNIFMYGWTAL